ncbi:helix-turn-helix transcriptional regulator [Sphingomonas sp. NBWT7]|uniref:helix-turn-helix domain-containing protein n=1 Tax=Sphingomonas sp. NBWT7 TaxID=2596913 RepID=UPI0016297CF1|nr:AraC family transcriptional regulator [Sphingomonas sp. NBWT7]QNE31686.1 helix-turn-helix transcriptional regulator [Sphingomonas sp. NBWT7]
MNVVQLDYRVPPDDLRPYVTLFYDFRADLAVFDDVERADHAQLRLRLRSGPEASYEFADGRCQSSPMLHVIGPTTGAIRTRADGPIELVGMGLQPAGWHALFGIEASAMIDRAADACDLLGDGVTDAAAAMRAVDGIDARIDIAADFVRRAVASGARCSIEFAARIDAWLAGSASPDVAELVAMTGLSRRQVERRCNALYGAPPKVLARKYRALRAASALASGSASLDELLAEGFYDQSHLIRELKRFIGMTPRQLRERPTLLAQLTIRQRHALHGLVHPIISDT